MNSTEQQQPVPDEQTRLRLYRTMLQVRYIEKRIYDLITQDLIKGACHMSLGQEAVAAGFGIAMRGDDYTFCSYRGHAHTLVRGAPMAGVLGELMGRECGLMRGKGGSMHLTSVAHGAMGSYAIVGAHLPIAVGAAWSAQFRGSGQVVVCYFGDGATNIGAFHEALNLAAVWKLPVVFVCENNRYMEYTPIDTVTAVKNPAADRAAAYGLEPILVNGNDADVIYDMARRSLAKAREGGGPSLIEALIYRPGSHSRVEPAQNQLPEEIEDWVSRDPVPMYRRRLIESGIEEPVLKVIENETLQIVDEATRAAGDSPPPSVDIAGLDVWSDGGAAWRN